MSGNVEESLLAEACKIEDYTDQELLALSLGNNAAWGDNYKMAMTIRLKDEISILNKTIKRFIQSNKISSWAMIILTGIIAVLTLVMILK